MRLQGQVDKLPGQLSGGQQQRVAIARAIVVEPPLVLMDEPLSNLDAKLRLEMRAEIRRIHNSLGGTTIYVTHDQEEALSLADRIVMLRDGEHARSARPDELFAKPDHLDVAEFMGFRNRIKGRVSAVNGDRDHRRARRAAHRRDAQASTVGEDAVMGGAPRRCANPVESGAFQQPSSPPNITAANSPASRARNKATSRSPVRPQARPRHQDHARRRRRARRRLSLDR